MSIKSDRWIKRMAHRQGMIEPFEASQIRTNDEHKIVSYGLSSYGYDVRCGDNFKIFTNINTSIVDPKSFDEKSFVDFQGDCCIIPPNSFALASTVEYFRVPENVLVLCVGKSTYARCFRGDTRVALVDGTCPSLEEMARRHEDGEVFRGYSIGPRGRLIVTVLDAPRFIGRDGLVEVTLDHGEAVRATPDHLFLARDGRMVEAASLRPGDSLMPLYRDSARGYEIVYQPFDDHFYPTHRLADECNLRHGIHADVPGTHRHPVDLDRRKGRPIATARRHSGPAEGERRSMLGKRARYRDDVLAASRGRRPEPAHRNHEVARVRDLPGEHDVYCLTVPEAGNFALAAGVFVRNCGVIVNVTPLEPGWEGQVTLEFSNTTPLPAKIYANEGVAQMLFLESDEQCEISYKDRAGKYMSQRGVTLPKT